jgi:hypothetical protein
MKKLFKQFRDSVSLFIRNKTRLIIRNVTRNRLEKLIDRSIESILGEILNNPKNNSWVVSTINKKFNYVSIDLSEYQNWHCDPKQLAKDITKVFNKRFTEREVSIAFLRKFNNITLHLLYGGEDSYNENCQIFNVYTPEKNAFRPPKKGLLKKLFESIWIWPTLIATTATVVLTVCSIKHFYNADEKELDKIAVINQNINFVTGIFGSFIMTFLMTRVLNLRQEKLKRAPQIKALSDKLAQFQKICFHLINDHVFWNESEDFKYAKRISDRISYWDAKGLEMDQTDVEFNYFQSLITAPGFRADIIWLYLQLKMFADLHPLQNLNLLYTKHPPVIIFASKEIKDFLAFVDYNEVYNYLDNKKNAPVYDAQSTFGKNIISAAKQFDAGKFSDVTYSKELLIDIADEVQNRVLPNLYYLLTLNEDKLPLSVKYYFGAVVSIISLTVIWPVLFNLFLSNKLFLNIGSIVLLGVFIHILLMFLLFLKNEALLKRPDDYR